MKFRFVKISKTKYSIQRYKWFGWRYIMFVQHGGPGSVVYTQATFVSKKEGFEYLINSLNKRRIELIEYPTLIIHHIKPNTKNDDIIDLIKSSRISDDKMR